VILRTLLLVFAVSLTAGSLGAQDAVPDAYRVKAAFLYNFFKFVEWPPSAPQEGPLYICVAGRNPFGDVLDQTVEGEAVNGRRLATRVILEPEPGCHILFVPDGAAATAYLRAARGTPALTVGERPDFITQGGMVSFFHQGTNIRFTINPDAAERAKVRISSRLLELAQIADDPGEAR
jgi:hypothetical protein